MSGEAKEDWAPATSAVRGVATVISVSSNGKYLIYTNGSNVVVRSVADPTLVTVYTEHTSPVKVAKFSPNNNWVASGDEAGKVRVWAWNRADHLLKLEVDVLGGAIEDIAWDFESKRLFAVGAGANKAKFFMFDTGANLGDVVPMSKKGLSCDLKPCRPFAAACGGEDFQLQFYTGGPPFKYSHAITEHTNFVNCVRYAPDGSKFISVSSDRQGIVYDGKTGAVTGRLDASGGHSGSIYHVSFSPDGSQFVTSSADKTLKIWDSAALTCVKTIVMGGDLNDMQNSVFWYKGGIVSLSLDGRLNFFASSSEDAPALIVTGHQAPITSFAFDAVVSGGTGQLYTICSAGRVMRWTSVVGDEGRFVATPLSGESHKGKGVTVAISGGEVATIAWDDKLRVSTLSGDLVGIVPTGRQPRGLAVSKTDPSLRVIITSEDIRVFSGMTQISETPAPYEPTSVALSNAGNVLAVGGADTKLHLYSLSVDGAITAIAESRAIGGAITTLQFSPNDATIATGDGTRDVRLYSAVDASVLKSGKWQAHTTRVTNLAWNPNGSVFATVSLDRRVCIWNPEDDRVVRVIDLAQSTSLMCVGWQSETVFWTLGSDGVMKRWTL